MSNKFTIMDGKELNLDQIEGRFAAFERLPYAVTLRLSKPLAKDGYGVITVDGTQIPKGREFLMDMIVKSHCLMVPVGSVAHDYDKEYTMHLTGFTAEDGTPFADTTLKFKTKKRQLPDLAHKEHDEVAVQAAREGMVLLKNENATLPLAPGSALHCFGSAQYIFRNTATGAGLINPRWQANFHQAVTEHSTLYVNQKVSSLYRGLEDVVPSDELLAEVEASKNTAVVFISRCSGEFLDNRPVKGGYYLTDDERAMITKVSAAYAKTVAVINTGYPVEMGWVDELGIDAVIYTGFAGMGAGYALVEILDGRTNPSGKLPDTWTYDYYDHPSAHNFINLPAEHKAVGEKEFGVHIFYEEDIYVGYRYFDSFNKPYAYSFGHGLSYTTFDLACGDVVFANDTLSANVTVTNTGAVAGKEVVQLYVQAPEGSLEKPYRVLAAFEKTKELAPGESQTLSLTADASLFTSYDEAESRFVLEAGDYHVWIGDSLAHANDVASFTVDGLRIIESVHRINPPMVDFPRLTKAHPEVSEDSKIVDLADRIGTPAPRKSYTPEPLPAYKGARITYPQVKANPSLLDAFIAQMSDAELCTLNVCGGADWYLPWGTGAAGKTVPFGKYKLPRMMVSDGNTGLNLKKSNIGFPSSCTVAATFNKDLAYQVGRVIAEESKEHGIGLNLGPAMNIHRNILNGRHPEYFSEDPVLSGLMAGHHGKGLRDFGCGSTYKHLFCNGSDTSRKASHSIVSERALRELYFKTFAVAMQISQPSAVMTSYNAVNGIYPAENVDILQTLLRDEWGFTGYIMTDWGTYDTVDPVEMVKAGNGWLTEGGSKYVKELKKAVKEGRLSRAVLEHNVRYLVKTLAELDV